MIYENRKKGSEKINYKFNANFLHKIMYISIKVVVQFRSLARSLAWVCVLLLLLRFRFFLHFKNIFFLQRNTYLKLHAWFVSLSAAAASSYASKFEILLVYSAFLILIFFFKFFSLRRNFALKRFFFIWFLPFYYLCW